MIGVRLSHLSSRPLSSKLFGLFCSGPCKEGLSVIYQDLHHGFSLLSCGWPSPPGKEIPLVMGELVH